ncbi:hypothetical protein HYALB_00006405 [Hymenoscyphus albidus]|uniref:Polygalacturonase n=1 Tax=Hymenoscyphus albidus TaxID=595503 RepID=A0A9N9Q5Q4_9HELO|nr:hypothetical protein HYALB_00006405 [Hymenoscyphus albidus]
MYTPGNCTSSPFQIRNTVIKNLHGTSTSENIASLKCAAVTCPNITIEGTDVRSVSSGVLVERYSCVNVRGERGFVCVWGWGMRVCGVGG